jgi:DNA-binding CsgD family transcriptional regulator
MIRGAAIGVLVTLQALCVAFFLYEIGSGLMDLGGPIPWRLHELIEIGAALGLLVGLVLGLFALRNSFRRTRRAEERLREASGAFHELIEARFEEWGLTAAERDVALFALKGFSTSEIARLRTTSDGTVKAQSASIYRKAGVTNRAQLLSVFIEHLLGEDVAAGDENPERAEEQFRPTGS